MLILNFTTTIGAKGKYLKYFTNLPKRSCHFVRKYFYFNAVCKNLERICFAFDIVNEDNHNKGPGILKIWYLCGNFTSFRVLVYSELFVLS